MAAAGRERAVQFSWQNITAKVDDYYSFVMRRMAAQGTLPPHVNREALQAEPALSNPAREES
jgi:hypothetical protein